MFDHIGIGATDLERTKAFFSAALEPLGIGIAYDGGDTIGVGPKGKPSLWIGGAKSKPTPIHIAFTADNRKQVDDSKGNGSTAGKDPAQVHQPGPEDGWAGFQGFCVDDGRNGKRNRHPGVDGRLRPKRRRTRHRAP